MNKMRLKMSHFLKLNFVITSCKTAVSAFFFVMFIVACSNDKPDKIAAIADRSKMPKIHATDITTIISDSGITRYRISTPVWNVYDKASQPYWEFPKGIHLERFNLNLKVDANIHSQYAKYNENEQVWELRGKVKSTNLQGELFETEQLFWNQRQERFYSDSLIKITRATSITKGIGFESDQSMTHYQIKHFQGIFPINENATSTASPSATTETKQSQQVLPQNNSGPTQSKPISK
ncbi:MAG: LPS export ABC transporter periplasmic protein LptC [Paludibacter sp.]|nr:LPS export ABC transporter periplasmic protein LptC [Paludibacter sp.]